MNLIIDPITQCIESSTDYDTAPIGKQIIPLEQHEWVYIQQNNIKSWTHDNGAFRYILCEAADNPVMSLRAGYHFRLRMPQELAQDPEHPIYPICYFHMNITDPYGDDPPGIKNDGVDQFSVAVALRSGPDPTDPIMTQITDNWRITIRKVISENDLTVIETDVRRLPITNGEVSFNYKSTAVGTYTIVADDFPLIDAVGIIYQVQLAKPVIFKVWQ